MDLLGGLVYVCFAAGVIMASAFDMLFRYIVACYLILWALCIYCLGPVTWAQIFAVIALFVIVTAAMAGLIYLLLMDMHDQFD
jgi:hypothetical protein